MNKSYKDLISESILRICSEYNLKEPLTVPSVGMMIASYDGLDRAIELFEGRVIEITENPDRSNPFAISAYKVTLSNVLLPMREN